MKLVIGIDLGTTGVRSILYDETLREIGEDYNEYPLIFSPDGFIEQDANLWWTLVKKSVVSALAKSGKPGEDVAGICISSQGISFLAVDGECAPMMNAISWLDKRAVADAEDVLRHFSEKQIYEITGKRTDSVYMLPKLLWLRRNKPDIFDNAAYFLMAHDFIVARLCGAYVTDYTMASGTMLFDINESSWSRTLLDSFAIDGGKLPTVCAAGSVAGTILPCVAEELGINADTVVFVGGQDQKCAALGAGLSEGIATISLGTAAAISRKWLSPRFDEKMRIPCFSDIVKGCWVTEGVISTAASSLKWLRDTFFPHKSYQELDEMANGANTGDLLFYPLLSGASSPHWHRDSCGCYYGFHLNTQPGEMIQALFEGVAFQIRENLEIMQGNESTIRSLRVFGGGARSKPWCQTIADITGLPVFMLNTAETACCGVAMLAGTGVGIFTSLSQAQTVVSVAGRCDSNPQAKIMYDEKYEKYLAVEKKLWS